MRLRWLLLAFLLLGIAVNFIVPLDWGPDEPYHLEYVHTLAYEHRLPTRQETHIVQHPPVYYGVMAISWRLITAQRPLSIKPGRHAMRAMTPEAKLARRVLRIFQTLLACISLSLMAQVLALLRVPRTLIFTWLATIAVWPMCGYLAGVVNNENASIAFSSLLCLVIVRHMMRGDLSTHDAACLGLLCGAGVLVKQTTLFAFPIALWGMVSLSTQTLRVRHLAIFFVAFLALGIWWPLHNVIVAGEPFPNYHETAGQFALPLLEKIKETPGCLRLLLETSFWPDWASRFVPRQIPFIIVTIFTIATVGVLIATFRTRNPADGTQIMYRRVQILSLIAIVFLVSGVLQYIFFKDFMAQIGGRYLLNSLPWLLALFGSSLHLLPTPSQAEQDDTNRSTPIGSQLVVQRFSIAFLGVTALIAIAWWLLAWTYYDGIINGLQQTHL